MESGLPVMCPSHVGKPMPFGACDVRVSVWEALQDVRSGEPQLTWGRQLLCGRWQDRS